jgi:hypothetical protein
MSWRTHQVQGDIEGERTVGGKHNKDKDKEETEGNFTQDNDKSYAIHF